jgi:hypothetical protein
MAMLALSGLTAFGSAAGFVVGAFAAGVLALVI